MPMIAFIGVRISWLMLARKSAFMRVAASAASFRTRDRSSFVRFQIGDHLHMDQRGETVLRLLQSA